MEKHSGNSKCQGRNDFASLNVQRIINNKKYLKVCVLLEFLYGWKMVLMFKVFFKGQTVWKLCARTKVNLNWLSYLYGSTQKIYCKKWWNKNASANHLNNIKPQSRNSKVARNMRIFFLLPSNKRMCFDHKPQ